MGILNKLGLFTARDKAEAFAEGESLGKIRGREQYSTSVAGPCRDDLWGWSLAESGGNPDPVLFLFGKERGFDYYRDMIMKDPQLQMILRRRKDRVLALDRKVAPSSVGEEGPNDNDDRLARFTTAWMDNMSKLKQAWEDMLEADALGFSVGEIIWGEGTWEGTSVFWPVCIQKRDQNYFSFDVCTHDLIYDPAGNFTRGQGKNMDELFPGKFIRMSFGPTNNPWGEGLVRNLHCEAWRKSEMGPGEMVAIEKFGVGTIHGKVAPGATDAATRQKLENVMETLTPFQSSNVIATTDDVAVDILESANIKGETPYAMRRNYSDAQMAKSGLGSTLTSDNGGGVGSFALGNVHMTGEDMIIVKISEDLDDAWNDQIVKWAIIVNFGEQERYPKIQGNTEMIKTSSAELEEDAALQKMGLPLTAGYIASKYDKPLPAGVDPNTVLVPLDMQAEGEVEAGDADFEAFAEAEGDSPHRKRASRQLDEYFAAIDKAVLEGAELKSNQIADASARLADATTPTQAMALIPEGADSRVQEIENLIADTRLLFDLMAIAHVAETVKDIEIFADALTRQEILASPYGDLVDMFRQRSAVDSATFDALGQAARREAFSFAGDADAATVRKVQNALVRTLESGGTITDFARDAGDTWAKSASHLDTVWQTNAQQAYTAGVDAQAEEFGSEAYPFAELVTQGDADVRESHELWDGFIAPPDDNVWKQMAPLNSFSCRCQKVLIHATEVEEENIKPTDSRTRTRLLRQGRADPAFR